MHTIPLNKKNLSTLEGFIKVPSYDLESIETGIVHIGVGGFHRSHQAYYIHQLLEQGQGGDWGICGVGLREEDREINRVLHQQDFLYSLVTQHPNQTTHSEIIGSMTDFILAVDEPQKVIDVMAQANTKIVSMTITEGGYNFDPHTLTFNFDNPLVQFEIQHPDQPQTVFGFLTAALKIRKEKGDLPFTILSCDNIQHNGDMTRNMLMSFVERQAPSLVSWIEEHVCFPNTMVDRITPVTSSETREYLHIHHHVHDEWPVICEPYIQWVIEDTFSNGRPKLENLGVQFVQDVSPYEKMKIRLLNAGHSVLGIPGALYGHPTIDACMRDSVFSEFMRKFMDEEATKVVGKIEGIDLEEYKNSLENRFVNPNIKDGLSRICSQSSAKLPKFLFPTIKENLLSGASIKYGTFVLAAWCFYHWKRVDNNNHPIEIIDDLQDQLHQYAKASQHDELSFLKLSTLFGELSEEERFIQVYKRSMDMLNAESNIREVMNHMLSN
ncbi:MAG: mannitol dehydrogenase family protein [Bacteroidota bacterium]